MGKNIFPTLCIKLRESFCAKHIDLPKVYGIFFLKNFNKLYIFTKKQKSLSFSMTFGHFIHQLISNKTAYVKRQKTTQEESTLHSCKKGFSYNILNSNYHL